MGVGIGLFSFLLPWGVTPTPCMKNEKNKTNAIAWIFLQVLFPGSHSRGQSCFQLGMDLKGLNARRLSITAVLCFLFDCLMSIVSFWVMF